MSQGQSRMFIGLELDKTTKLAINHWRETHLSFLPGKPVPMENYHITLSFLGHIPASKMESLDLLLQKVSESNEFSRRLVTAEIAELGTFLKPQVLYLGVTKTDTLMTLAKRCRSVNNKLSLPQHHSEYRPHISLCRKHLENTPIDVQTPKLKLRFDQFHLFESVSSSTFGKPPSYIKRLSYTL